VLLNRPQVIGQPRIWASNRGIHLNVSQRIPNRLMTPPAQQLKQVAQHVEPKRRFVVVMAAGNAAH
jgi:hypothetical protein